MTSSEPPQVRKDISLVAPSLNPQEAEPLLAPPAAPLIREDPSPHYRDFLSMMEGMEKDDQATRDQDILMNLRKWSDTEAGLSAEMMQLGVDLKVGADIPEEGLEAARNHMQSRQFNALVLAGGNEPLMKSLLNPDFARLVHDDLDNLVQMGNSTSKSWNAGDLGRRISLLNFKRMTNGGKLSAAEQIDMERMDLALSRLPKDSSGYGPLSIWYGTARMLGGMWDTALASAGAAVATGGAAKAASLYVPGLNIASAAWSARAGLVTMFAMSGRQIAGESYGAMRDMGISHDGAWGRSVVAGVAGGILETVGFKVGGKIAGQALAKFYAGRASKEALNSMTRLAALGGAAKAYGKGLGAEIGTEEWQMLNQWGLTSDALKEEGLEDTRGSLAEEFEAVFWETARGVALINSFGPALQYRNDSRRASDSRYVEQQIKQFGKVLDESKVKDRGEPGTRALMQYLSQAIEDGDGPKTLIFEVDTLSELMVESDITMEELQETHPEVATAMRQAEIDGLADIEIPTAEFGVKFMQSEIGKAMIPHARTEADGMTAAEGVAFEENKEAIAEEGRKILEDEEKANEEFRAEISASRKTRREQLIAAGINPREADVAANVHAHRLAVLTDRVNSTEKKPMTPAEVDKKYFGEVVRDEGVDEGQKAEAQHAEEIGAINAQIDKLKESANESGKLDVAELRDEIVALEKQRDALAAEGVDRQALGQPIDSDAKGRFFAGDRTTALSAKADTSTVLHEMMHEYTNALLMIASEGEVPTAIAKDVDSMLRFWKIEGTTFDERFANWQSMSFEEQAPHQESVTYNYELWLFTGKAPNVGLSKLFARIRTFMLGVYTSLTKAERRITGAYKANFGEDLPGITPELREMFERMLASEEAAIKIEAVREMGPMFSTVEEFIEAGHSEEEWSFYQEMAEEQHQQLITDLSTDSTRAMQWANKAQGRVLNEMKKEHREKRKVVRAEVAEQVKADPLYQILDLFKEEGSGLDKGAVLEMLRGMEPEALAEATKKLKGILKARKKLKKEKPAKKDAADRRRSETLKKWQAKQREDFPHSFEKSVRKERADGRMVEMTWAQVQTVIDHLQPAVARWEEIQTSPGQFEINGYHPDFIAEYYEDAFATGRDLVVALVDALPIKKEIEARTTIEMQKRFGDPMSPEEQALRVEQAVHSEARSRFVAAEQKFLDRTTKPVPVLIAAADEAARRILAGRALNDMDPVKFAQLEAREGAAARRAMKTVRPRKESKDGKPAIEGRGPDPKAAAVHKHRELLYNRLAKMSIKVKEEVTKARAMFKEVAKGSDEKVSKTRDVNLVHIARSILANYGLVSKSRAARTADFMDRMQKYAPELFERYQDEVLASVLAGRDADYDHRNMTLDEFQVLRELIESLWYGAKVEKGIMIDGKRQKIADILTEMREGFDRNKRKETPGRNSAVPDTWWSKKKDQLNSTRATLTKVEHYMRYLDGGKAGPFTRYLYREIEESVNAYRADAVIYTKEFVDDLKDMRKRGLLDDSAIVATELGLDDDGQPVYTFGGKGAKSGGLTELLGALLHMGNEINRSKFLLAGRGGKTKPWADVIYDENGKEIGINYDRWDAFIDRMVDAKVLTKEHFDFLQRTWDLMEKIKPKLQAAHMRIEGHTFKEQAPSPFTREFPDGTTESYRGGYVPAAVDYRAAVENGVIAGPPLVDEAHVKSEFKKGLPSVANGFTKNRAEKLRKRPLTMDIDGIVTHIDQTLRYAHVGPAVADMGRLISDETFLQEMAAVDPTAVKDILTPFLDRAVTQTLYKQGNKAHDRFFKNLRRITGVKVMFGSVVNALQQLTGLSNALLYVKPRNLQAGLAQSFRHPKQATALIVSRSTMMDDRMKSQMFELTDDLRAQTLRRSKGATLQEKAVGSAYILQIAFQNAVDRATWLGSYNQHIEEHPEGLSMFEIEKNAVREADSAVRLSQGDFSPQNQADYEKGTPAGRAWTQFTSYFNTLFNQLGYAQKEDRVSTLLLAHTVPSIVAAAISMTFYDRWDGEDDDGHVDAGVWQELFIGSQLRTAAGMLPGYGSAGVNIFDRVFGDRPFADRVASAPAISTLGGALHGAFAAMKAMANDDADFDRQNIKDAMTAVVMFWPWGGAALAPLVKPLSYGAGVALGETEPTGPLDAIRGAVSGYASEESRR